MVLRVARKGRQVKASRLGQQVEGAQAAVTMLPALLKSLLLSVVALALMMQAVLLLVWLVSIILAALLELLLSLSASVLKVWAASVMPVELLALVLLLLVLLSAAVALRAAGGVDEAGDVVGGVAAAAISIDIAGVCSTDGAGIVDDACIALALVVGSVISIIEVQSRVSGCEVGAKASVGRKAQGVGRCEVSSAETSGGVVVTARAGVLSKVFVIIDGLEQ